MLRDLVHDARRAARSVPDPLSGTMRAAERLPAKADAVLAIHAPRSHPEAAAARERLVLEELLLMQLGLLLHKSAEQRASRALALGRAGETAARFLSGLPFALTAHQTKAIADAVSEGLRAQGVRATRAEGQREAQWILLDYLDMVVHVFTPGARDFYRLEALWGDVPRVSVDSGEADDSAASRTG